MRTYRFQFREPPAKHRQLGHLLDDLCDVHNHFLKLEKRYYRLYGKYAGRYRLQPHLTKLLKRTKKHWTWIPRDTLDAVIIRLHLAWERFFNLPKEGMPKFKKKHRYRSAKFQTGYKLENGRVQYSAYKAALLSFKSWNAAEKRFKFERRYFSFHQHREWHGNVRYIQVLRDSVGTYWLYVVTDNKTKEVLPTTGENVGIDFGLETYLTLSTGEKIQHPQPLKDSLKKLRTLSKAVSRKAKGSGNWWRAIRELARFYRHVSNQRKDWHWKLATDLCRRFDVIVTETLNLDGMKRLWGRKVSDLAFYQFVQILEYKCCKHEREFLQVGQWTATTKPCSECGYVNKNLSLSDRQWTCPDCGSHHDRDRNAKSGLFARILLNILRAACDPSVEQI